MIPHVTAKAANPEAWPADGELAAKVQVPQARQSLVPRTRILRRLRADRDRRFISIVAPAGYGKTSILVQWASAEQRPTAWLTVDGTDNDPVAFLDRLATSLSRVVFIDRDVHDAIASRGVPVRAIVGQLLTALAVSKAPVLVAVDDTHLLTDRATLDALAEFIMHLPEGAQLGAAGRQPMDMPLERWRLDGTMVDVGVAELAMDTLETSALARLVLPDLPEDAVQRLREQTAGWPALLALASAAVRRTGDLNLLTVSDPSVLASDYLRTELMQHRPASEVEFMTRTSILERLSGPLCDAVLERQGSAAVLEDLGRSTLLVDEYAGWFRYHPILRGFLQNEFDMREPGLAAVLHRRAAAWHDAAGDDDHAVEHAFRSGDPELAALSVAKAFLRLHWTGRRTTVRGWIGRFDETALAERPWLTLMAAFQEMSAAHVGEAERLADLAERGTCEGLLPGGITSIESGRAMVRAILARRGATAALADAEFAADLEGPASPWHDFAKWILSLTRFASGDMRGGDEALAQAMVGTRAGRNVGLAFNILGHGADRAMDRQEWQTAAEIMRDIDTLAVGRRFDGYPSSVLTRVAALRLLQRRGDVRAVRAGLAKAAVLRPTLSAANPVVSVMGLLGYARLHLAVNDPAGARAVLYQASDILRLRPDLGVLPAEVAALGKVLTAMPVGISGASALTTAELRVLQLLPYYLSFKEIAQRLGVKATTIKTHALAIYGKLGASSRSEAIDLAVENGLMDAFPTLRPASPIAEDAATADE